MAVAPSLAFQHVIHAHASNGIHECVIPGLVRHSNDIAERVDTPILCRPKDSSRQTTDITQRRGGESFDGNDMAAVPRTLTQQAVPGCRHLPLVPRFSGPGLLGVAVYPKCVSCGIIQGHRQMRE